MLWKKTDYVMLHQTKKQKETLDVGWCMLLLSQNVNTQRIHLHFFDKMF